MALTKTKKSVIDISSIISGNDGEIQFNKSNEFSSSSSLKWDDINNRLSVKAIEQDGIVTSPVSGRKNVIINGNFNIWQRGNTLSDLIETTGIRYLADRWHINNTLSSGTLIGETYEKNSFLVGGVYNSSVVTDNPLNYVTFGGYVINGQGYESNYICQPIESVFTLAGKRATLSFWARGTVSNQKIGVSLEQHFSSTASSQVESVQEIILTTNWQKYTLSFNIPSVNGKAITLGEDYLGVYFWTNRGNNMSTPILYQGNVNITNVQLEEGTVATEFDCHDYGDELAKCRRYYETISYTDIHAYTSRSGAGVAMTWRISLVPKVTSPNLSITVNKLGVNWSGFDVSSINKESFLLIGNTTGGTLYCYNADVTIAVDSEYYT